MNTLRNKNSSTSAFTLIELLLVVTMLGFALAATPFYSKMILANAVVTAQNSILGNLRMAQTFAIAGKQNSAWGVNLTGGVLTVYSGNSYATRTAALDLRTTLNSNITITGLTEINFSRITGRPNVTPTITIASQSSTRTIYVNSEGRISQ